MDTDTRLDLIETRNQLLDLISSYGQGFDNQDPDLLHSIWTEDATLTLGPWGTHAGVDQIMAAAEGFWAASPYMHHWTANPLLEIDLEAGTATAISALNCLCTYIETGTFHIGGNYRDCFVRQVDGRWLIAERVLDLAFYTPLPDWKPTQGSETDLVETGAGA